MTRTLCTMLALLTLAGCEAGNKSAVHDTFSLVSDAKPNIRTVIYGSSTGHIKTRGDYGWLQFNGRNGDNIDLWVRSKDGDAVAFLLDSQDNVLAANDDAYLHNSDAHIVAPLGADGVYYIAFREYSYARSTFSVTLNGKGIFSCGADSDCVAVPKAGCCNNGHLDAINGKEVEAYDVTFACSDSAPVCPKYRVQDNRVAACDAATHACVMVDPAN